ncbi:uncharacterized protein LOC126366647 [Pectinophora gossypiella]|uniref:uncharacterized protein LOC126366647 n=1 Tax=Pectinophora gossypiella TaxID=13191 RepID=UPI00214F3902|nr:uncharacterized protein LOC126366647 [Pectinophora gossypiella]
MQCFICMTYMIFIATAHPSKDRELVAQHERSLFRDVIESLRIRSQLPEDFAQNENNLAQNYNQYGYDNQQQLPSDADFVPRRNDRIEMPTLKYRFPKSLNDTDDFIEPKEEIVVFIDTTKEPRTTTPKPKKQKRTRPPANKVKVQKDEEIIDESATQKPEEKPITNTMAGQSQIGNRESQMVVKPTVIVNIRGSVSHKDGEIKIAGRNNNETVETFPNAPQNIFHINQEVKLERTFTGMGSSGGQKKVYGYQEENTDEKPKNEEDMMMCETATWNPEKNRDGRRLSNVLQILFSL